jgi:hypothetical protein
MKRRAYFYVEIRLDLMLTVAMQKTNRMKLDNLPDAEKEIILNAIKKTVRFYMAQEFSFGYACATAASQSNIQKGVILKEIAKDRAMIALRDEQRASKRFNKRKFLLGVEASKAALELYKQFES